MKAVNLIPADARRSSGVKVSGGLGPGYAVIALLGLAVLFVSIYVLTSNTISDRQAKLGTLQAQVSQEQSQANRLTNYAAFLRLTQARVATVRQIASSRFDWHAALADLSRVIPANTSLQSLTGTVAPGATVSGAGGSAGGSASSLRGAIASPAFELQGCTKTQDDVARLMSRLRLINQVQRVTLASSLKQEGGQTGAAVSTASSAGTAAPVGCGASAPTFDLVVFFQALPGVSSAAPGAGPVATSATSAAANTAAAPSSAASTTPAAGAATPAGSTPAAAASSSTSQPISNPANTSGGSK